MGLYNIPLGAPFLRTLADGIIDRFGKDPLQMGQVVVLLPTRRGCLSLKEILLKKAKENSLILPRIYALAELEQNPVLPELPLLSLPRVISKWERLGQLSQLIQQFLKQKKLCDLSAAAFSLAQELATLLDEFYISNVSLKSLETLVESDFSTYWQQNLAFLKIISDFWPAVLKERGAVEAAQQSQVNLRYVAAEWNPSFPVILAGTTGTRPATAELAKKVLSLPQGMVVLPGHDISVNSVSLPPTHANYTLAQFVTYLGNETIEEWSPAYQEDFLIRSKFLIEMMAPTLRHEKVLSKEEKEIIEKTITPINCDSIDQEAMVIAALLRQTYETPEKTAVVITPDLGLTKRIQSYLRRWEIEVNTSSGIPLGGTVVGTFLSLISRVDEEMSLTDWLSLLKHPLFMKLEERGSHLSKVRELECQIYRKKRMASFLDLKYIPDDLKEWYETLLGKVSPLLYKKPKNSFRDWLRAHEDVAFSLADEALWSGDDGEEAKTFIQDLRQQTESFSMLSWRDYGALFQQLMQGICVHDKKGIGSPLRILGTLEARQVEADVIILAGLNEGSWPQMIEEGPWLSNQMRLKLGLPDLSRRLGLAAHDFAVSFAAPEVYLTRSSQNQGVTIPSRLWQRFHTVANINNLTFKEMDSLKALIYDLDMPESISVIMPPQPKPLRQVKPDQLSVTDIERLIRDPYSLYASKILKLKKLEELDQPLSGREWGQLVHRCLEQAFKKYAEKKSESFMEVLVSIGQAAFKPYEDDIIVKTFWWNRYLQICDWLQNLIAHSFQNLESLRTEAKGTLELLIAKELITLKTIADRIDNWGAGNYHIIDYKTGSVPSIKDVEAGFSPQLTLEGLILKGGGFPGHDATNVEAFYWALKGGMEGGAIKKLENYDRLITEAEEGLITLLEYFYSNDAVYLACPWGEERATFKDYFHLARVEEWM